ncbi:hypothetical protein U9J66_06110 [Nocardiopsis sp. LDBS1602]|nr:hypothetical protein [Nocardiopsis sp. LDBS1602]
MTGKAREDGGGPFRLGPVPVWIGAGLLVGALLWLVTMSVTRGEWLEASGGSLWWTAVPLAVLILRGGMRWRRRHLYPPSVPVYLVWMSLACLLALYLVWSAFPEGLFSGTTPEGRAVLARPDDAHVWLVVCAVALGCLLMLAGGRRFEPRPARRFLPMVGIGAVAVVLVGVSLARFVVPWVPHRVAGDLGEPEAIPATVSGVGWEWRPPQGQEIRAVEVWDHGPLVLLSDGVTALDGASGAERWSYLRPNDPVDEVWTRDGRVHVRHLVGETEDGEDPRATDVLDPADGRVVEVRGDLVPPPRDGSYGEWDLEILAEISDLPEDCTVTGVLNHGPLIVGTVGCPDEDGELFENAVRANDPFGWEGTGVDARLVAVDREEEIELWTREWSVPPGEEGPRQKTVPEPGEGHVVVLERGPEGRTLVLDAETGEDLVVLPEEHAYSADLRGVVAADANGAVIARETGELETTFHRIDPSGEVTGTAVVEGVYLHDITIGGSSIAVLEDALAFVGARDYLGESGYTLVAPFGETVGWESPTMMFSEGRAASEAIAVPGALVAVARDGGSERLEGWTP